MRDKMYPELLIPDHDVIRKIGGGAYGDVWLARGVTGALRACLLYTSPSPRDATLSRMPSSA